MAEPTQFGRELVARFSGCHIGGEVWVRYEHAGAAIDLAEQASVRLLGMEGFLVGGGNVYPSMSRITDYSAAADPGTAYAAARALLAGAWVSFPDDLHGDAKGDYMIDLVVAE
jgi:hypothetical protein